MKTKIDKSFHVSEPIDKVWDLLSDPQKVVVCVPGASITEVLDDKNYKGTVSLKFGPVKSTYNGEISIEEMDTAARQMTLKGKGLDSKGKGSADMEMSGSVAEKDGGSQVDYSMEVSVTGMLAQFGSRLIQDVSNQLFDQFVQNFKQKLAEGAPAQETATSSQQTVSGTETGQTETSTATATQTASTAQQEDNSVNAFALLWALIKGFFKRLFGKSG